MKKRPAARTVIGFDTEDDGKGTPFLWAFAHDRGVWHTQRRPDALQWIANASDDARRRNRVLQLWATNLEYDLVNVFEPERIPELSLRFGRSALCGASWHGAEFRDTVRHVPIGVAEWGTLVGLEKREANLFSGRPRRVAWPTKRTLAAFIRRCVRDAAITGRAARFLHDRFRRMGERPRMTLASTALGLWRSKYWQRPLGRVSPELWNAALASYHGGRTQAFAVGTFPDVRAIDVASMFPWAMTVAPLPLPWGLQRRVRPGSPLEPCAIIRARVRSNLSVPRLPVRTREGTIYPNWEWTGWYVGEELMAFRSVGGDVRVLGGYAFAESCDPFTSYVRTMFRRKQRSRGANRLLYKLMLNALYGKFGQQGKRVFAVPIQKLARMKSPPLAWRPWNGLAIFTKDGLPPPWGNNVWPAFVTARARVRLANELESLSARGCRPLYCDTDSVIFTGRARYAPKARRIGDFELRGDFRAALIVGKKEYALTTDGRKWTAHVKGVPSEQRETYLRSGRASFARPVKIREAARHDLQPNVWRRVTKQRRTDLRKRARKADGALPIPVLTGTDTTVR